VKYGRQELSERSATFRQIVNFSEMDSSWNWLAHRYTGDKTLRWTHVSANKRSVPSWIPRAHNWRRLLAAWNCRVAVSERPSVLVSHGPRMTLYSSLSMPRAPATPHLAYAFNYTSLPRGVSRRLQAAVFQGVDRFVVFSKMERVLYADVFDIDPSRIDVIHWAVRPPEPLAYRIPVVRGDYICAIGSQGRDYATLIEAMRRLPAVTLVLVATSDAMRDVGHIPVNVDVRIGIPLTDATNILAHCKFMVLPLTGRQVPCGHVTLVSAMHLKKAIIATTSSGISDYVQDSVNGRLTDPCDSGRLASLINELADDPGQCERLGYAGQQFAQAHCTEDNVVEYFTGVVPALLAISR
jgi:glycosyltransferase involved in cell wall biosynthesis